MSILELLGYSEAFIVFIQFMVYVFLSVSSVLIFTYIGSLSDRLLIKLIDHKGAVIFLSGIISAFITIIYFLIGKAFLFSWFFWLSVIALLILAGYITFLLNKFRFKE